MYQKKLNYKKILALIQKIHNLKLNSDFTKKLAFFTITLKKLYLFIWKFAFSKCSHNFQTFPQLSPMKTLATAFRAPLGPGASPPSPDRIICAFNDELHF